MRKILFVILAITFISAGILLPLQSADAATNPRWGRPVETYLPPRQDADATPTMLIVIIYPTMSTSVPAPTSHGRTGTSMTPIP